MKLDRIILSTELLSPAALSEVLRAPLENVPGPQVPQAVRVPVAAAGATIEFTPAISDWKGADQIVVPLYVPEGARPMARIRVDCGSHTPGLVGNDYMQCYYRYLHSGWGRLEFPYENMLIFGTPDQWRNVTMVSVVLQGEGEGEFLVGGLTIEERERPAGPRMTDEELFAALDLGRSGLEGVREAAEDGDLASARNALVAYLRAREYPILPYPNTPTPRSDYDTRAVDLICRHYILEQQLGKHIDWRANPIGYLEWMHAFNRHGFLGTLVEAYLATGDEAYAAKLDYLLSTWMEASPPPVGNNGGGDPAWETLSTACRISVGSAVWVRIWSALRDSPSFRPETRIAMFKSFYEHAEHMVPYPTGHNWLVAESSAVATVGMLFPEYMRSADWRRIGMERLEREIAYQVYPDGAQFELSPGYHRMCADIFANVYALARSNEYPVSDAFSRRLESMYDYTMHVTRPDGTRPSLNDAGAADISTAPELYRGDALFSRPDFRYVASQGREGAAPTETSHAFPYAGHYVMRTGWDREALWALVDAGPYGAAHQHEDKLNIELYAYGTRFVLDPGIASYLDDPLTHHQRATAAHNTVLVDGLGQDRRTTVPRARYRVEEPEPARWGSTARLDYLWAEYSDGYRGLSPQESPTHGRLVLFWKPHFWLVWDALLGAGEHEMSALWHWGPMLVQQQPGGVVRSNRLGLANLELLPLGAPDGVDILCGEQDPVQGWLTVSEPARQVVPAPVAIYRKRGALPMGWGVLAAPFLSGTASGWTVSDLVDGEVSGARLHLATRVTGPGGERLEVLYADAPADLALGAVRAQAQGLVVYRAAGAGGYVAALHGTGLRVADRVVADLPDAQAFIESELSDTEGPAT